MQFDRHGTVGTPRLSGNTDNNNGRLPLPTFLDSTWGRNPSVAFRSPLTSASTSAFPLSTYRPFSRHAIESQR
jgi:hypothetical protein